jgi:hypothetical protein
MIFMAFSKHLNQNLLYSKKFHCILFLKILFDGFLFFNFYFDITMKYFLNSHFSFYLGDKSSLIISNVHYGSFFL